MYTHHKFDHEFDGPFEVRASYMVCAVPRCGSSLLCEFLCLTELAGAPTEFFDAALMERFSEVWGADGLDAYLRALMSKKTGPNGVFGLKAHYFQLEETLGDRVPRDVFPNMRFVYMSREDKLRQAVSYARALQTGRWASDHPEGNGKPVFDAAQIRELLEQIAEREASWERFFRRHRVEPFRVSYEDLVDRPEATVEAVMGFVGVDPPQSFALAAPTLERQADDVTEEWVRQFQSLERAGGRTWG